MSTGVIILNLFRMVRSKSGVLASIGAASQLEPQRYACILFCYSYRVASMFRNMLSIYLATPTLKYRNANPCNRHHSSNQVLFTQSSEGFSKASGLNASGSVKDLHLIYPESVIRSTPSRNIRGTYDLRLSPSFLNPSIILSISFLPCAASTLFPPMLILTFSFACAINSFLNNKCLICIQTNTPQSLLFSCWGESARSI